MASRDSETDNLLLATMHNIPIAQLYAQLQSSVDGLDSDKSKSIRSTFGLNKVPPPLNYPAWLCCLLPCLMKTKSMMDYNETVPEHANVRRNKNWIKIDATSLVPGDIVMVRDGERVPGDMRIVEVSMNILTHIVFQKMCLDL